MDIRDLVIVGAGPAGLSAAINGASELGQVLLIDSGKKEATGVYRRQLGGQAIGSTRIENYGGFPDGISGCELMARFEEQAIKLGTEILCPEHVNSLEVMDAGHKRITTREGSEIFAKAVILANGLSYLKLKAIGVPEFIGKGVLYGAPTFNPQQLGKCTICVVGAANSAGQAVLHLSKNEECQIKVLVRGVRTIEDQMSKYLVDRIHACHNIEVMQNVAVKEARGIERLQEIVLEHGDGSSSALSTDHLFIFIGAAPKTDWLNESVVRDSRNFIATDLALGTLHGQKFPYETSMPGVFAAGDIRFGSVKRVAAGVGEGSAAVSSVHQYLATSRR